MIPSPSTTPPRSHEKDTLNFKSAPTVLQLPVELLVDTFALVDRLERWGSKGCMRGRGIAKLMLVCRAWRDIALSTPHFWRHVDIDAAEPPPWVPVFLERSIGCTIDVRIFYPPPRARRPSLPAIEVLYPHCSRIRSLYVNLAMHDFPLVRPLFACKLTSLEHLDVVPVVDGSKQGPKMWMDCGLSREAQPRLRSLVVRQVWIPPPSHTWSTLRILKLYSYPTTTNGPLTIRDVLSVFSACKDSLEELYLWFYDMLPSSLGDASAGIRRLEQPLVRMSRIRVLSAHGSYLLISSLLRFLDLPNDLPHVDIRTTQLATEEPMVQNNAYSLFPLHTRSLLERPSDVTFSSSTACAFSKFEIRTLPPSPSPSASASSSLDSSCTRVGARAGAGDEPDPFFLSFQHPAQGLRALTEVLGWTPVRALALAGALPAPVAEDNYGTTLAAFPCLEELTLRPAPGTLSGRADVFAALEPPTRLSGDAGAVVGGRVCCPRLRALRVHGSCAGVADAREVLGALERCLRARAEVDVRIARLDLHIWVPSPGPGDCAALVLDDEEWVAAAVERMRASVDELRCRFGWQRGQCAACEGG